MTRQARCISLKAKKPRVLMLGWEFPPHITGGLGVACSGLYHALSQLTHIELILPANHTISSYTEGSLYSGDLARKVGTFSQTAVSRASQLNFDIIHAHDWMTFQAGITLKRASGKPLILHLHSSHFDRSNGATSGWIYNREKYAMEEANHVIAVSQHTRSILARHYGISEKKITVVHNGVEPVTSFRTQQPSDKKIITFLGRLTSQKSPRTFVKLAEKLAQHAPEAIFMMAGSGDQEHLLRDDVLKASISEKFQFLGFLNTQEVHHLLSRTHVYCMPSSSEPFGLSALEAAQFGVPCVLSAQSGAAEVLQGALTSDYRDIDGMSQQILSLLHDQSLRDRCISRNFESLESLTWQASATQTRSIYRRFVS